MSLSGSTTNLLRQFFHMKVWRNGILKLLEQNQTGKIVSIKYLINYVGVSMETGIRPEIRLAEFSKMKKKLYGVKNELIMPM